MACAIKLAGEDVQSGLSSNTWQKSANFVERMDAVIDACNVYSLKNRHALSDHCLTENQKSSSDLKVLSSSQRNGM